MTKTLLRNPFIRNIILQFLLVIISIFTLAKKCSCNESCCCNFHLSSTMENIVIGLLSASILLLLFEIFQMLFDKVLYGYLEGKYNRTIITDSIANSDIVKGEKRTEDLTADQKRQFAERKLQPIPDSRYVEVLGYRDIGKDWIIELKYLYHGIYEGTAEYHKYWETPYGQPTKVKFKLTLSIPNVSIGTGNYKYLEREDYGIYDFQVNASDSTEILVLYKNSIPSGLSEGYEKWHRQNS